MNKCVSFLEFQLFASRFILKKQNPSDKSLLISRIKNKK